MAASTKITASTTTEIPDATTEPKKKKRHLSPEHRAKSLRALKRARAAKKSGHIASPRASRRRRRSSFAARTTAVPFIGSGSEVAAGALPDNAQVRSGGTQPSHGDVNTTDFMLKIAGYATSRQRVVAYFDVAGKPDWLLLQQVQYGSAYGNARR